MSALVHSSAPSGIVPLEFSAEQVGVIKANFCSGFSEAEFSYCLSAAKSLGANPILRECHFLVQDYADRNGKRHRKVTVQLGIDFYRRRAMETGKLLGRIIEYGDPEGNWYTYLPAKAPLYAAKCTLLVSGLQTPIEAIAYWDEFGEPAQQSNPVWRTKRRHMLTKVAEAHAIRVMCAGQLAGTVTEDEVEASDLVTVQVTDSKAATARPSLSAPTAVAEMQPATEEKSPEDAKRAVLSGIIKDAIKRIDENNAERVKATVAGMTNPGPYARTWPAFDKWSTEQLEELVELYAQLEKAPQSETTEPEPDAIEAEVAVAETVTDPAPDPVSTKAEPEPEPDLADELAPKPSEVDENGKPKAPF